MKNATTILMIFLSIPATSLFSQQCGSVPSKKYLNNLVSSLGEREKLVNQHYKQRSSRRLANFSIPVQFHVTRTTEGTSPAVSDNVLLQVLDNLNEAYASMDISFMACGQTKFIDNSPLHTNFDKDQDDSKLNQYDDLFVLNIYIVGDLDGLNGYAKFPEDQEDRVVIEAENALTSTVIHEVGHYFSLLHTYSTSRGTEFVDGSNCLVSGDLICDTPPDPGERDFFSNCIYTGNVRDLFGSAYAPDGFNYMGRGQNTCRNRFSVMQQNRILASLMMDRYYLVDCSSTQPDITCTTTIESFPYEESFEDYTGGTDWKQNIDDQFGWNWGANTRSEETGPGQAVEGNYFIFTEASDFQNVTGIITSPCFNFQNQSEAAVSFSYHMYGVDIGKLELQISQNQSGTWTTLWDQVGNKGNQWNDAVVNLNEFVGSTIQLRFVARTAGGSKGDMAVDKFAVVSQEAVVSSIEDERVDESLLMLYPNPAVETLTIRYRNTDLTQPILLITSIDGRVMHKESIVNLDFSAEYHLDVSQWSVGTYFVRFIGQSKERAATFILKP